MIMRKKWQMAPFAVLLALAVSTAGATTDPLGQSYRIEAKVTGSGGDSQAEGYRMQSSVGQAEPDLLQMRSKDGYALDNGFWPAAVVPCGTPTAADMVFADGFDPCG